MELDGWMPQENIPYKGYSRHSRRGYHSGKVLIHLKSDQYIGGFFISGSKVTLWYIDKDNTKREISIPTVGCSFSKRREGNTNIYDVTIKNSDIMYNEENDKEGAERAVEGGVVGAITGRQEMATIRNRYQRELDKNNTEIMRKVQDLQRIIKDLHDSKNDAEQLKEGIDNYMSERDRAYSTLQNLLAKEEKYETGMLDKTLKGMKAKGRAIIKQKLKDVDIDTLQYGSVEQYKRLYPHYGGEIFSNAELVYKREREIREAQQAYNKAVSKYNALLETAGLEVQRAKDNFSKYEKTKQEGDKEIKSCRYYKSVLYKLAPKQEKVLLNLDVLKHDVEKFEHTFDMVREEMSAYKTSPLELMKYQN